MAGFDLGSELRLRGDSGDEPEAREVPGGHQPGEPEIRAVSR